MGSLRNFARRRRLPQARADLRLCWSRLLQALARRYGRRCHALGASAPERDLGLVDDEALLVGNHDARCRADEAFDVYDNAAVAADQVMVVVAGPGFEEGGTPGRLDSPGQSDVDQRTERVVDRLRGNGPQALRDQARQLVSAVMVSPRAQQVQDGDALGGAAQPCSSDV